MPHIFVSVPVTRLTVVYVPGPNMSVLQPALLYYEFAQTPTPEPGFEYFSNAPEEPVAMEPESAEPELAEPEPAEPKLMEPELVESELAELELAELEPAEPEPAEPEPAKPEPAKPEPAEPELAEPELESASNGNEPILCLLNGEQINAVEKFVMLSNEFNLGSGDAWKRGATLVLVPGALDRHFTKEFTIDKAREITLARSWSRSSEDGKVNQAKIPENTVFEKPDNLIHLPVSLIH